MRKRKNSKRITELFTKIFFNVTFLVMQFLIYNID